MAKDIKQTEIKEAKVLTAQELKDLEKTKEENETKKNINTTSSFQYEIELYDVLDSMHIRRPAFGANSVYEGNNRYLVNDKLKFKEPFPSSDPEYKKYTILEIDKKLKAIDVRKEKAAKGLTDDSIKDLEVQALALKRHRRSLEVQGDAQYSIINGSSGKPLFTFDRVGAYKVPVAKNADSALVYRPTETRTSYVQMLIKSNDEKNGEEKRLNIGTYGLIILLILLVIVMLFLIWKMYQAPGQSAELLINVSNNLVDVTKDLNSFTDSVIDMAKNYANPETNVQAGVQNATGR